MKSKIEGALIPYIVAVLAIETCLKKFTPKVRHTVTQFYFR